MKACKCGGVEFQTVIATIALIQDSINGIELSEDRATDPVVEGEIMGDLRCRNCGVRYVKWADIPNVSLKRFLDLVCK